MRELASASRSTSQLTKAVLVCTLTTERCEFRCGRMDSQEMRRIRRDADLYIVTCHSRLRLLLSKSGDHVIHKMGLLIC